VYVQVLEHGSDLRAVRFFLRPPQKKAARSSSYRVSHGMLLGPSVDSSSTGCNWSQPDFSLVQLEPEVQVVE
jgi:hypothetical protein